MPPRRTNPCSPGKQWTFWGAYTQTHRQTDRGQATGLAERGAGSGERTLDTEEGELSLQIFRFGISVLSFLRMNISLALL